MLDSESIKTVVDCIANIINNRNIRKYGQKKYFLRRHKKTEQSDGNCSEAAGRNRLHYIYGLMMPRCDERMNDSSMSRSSLWGTVRSTSSQAFA